MVFQMLQGHHVNSDGFLVVLNLAKDLHAALDVCDSGAVAALHGLLTMSRNEAWI